MTTTRFDQLPTGAQPILSLRDFHLFTMTPPATWPPAPDLEVYGGPQPDGQPHAWVRTTLAAALAHRPGAWRLADGYTPTVATATAPTLPVEAREFGRIGSSARLFTTQPLGLEPADADPVYVVDAQGQVHPMPYAIARKFGRWTPVDAGVKAQVASPPVTAIPARLRRP